MALAINGVFAAGFVTTTPTTTTVTTDTKTFFIFFFLDTWAALLWRKRPRTCFGPALHEFF